MSKIAIGIDLGTTFSCVSTFTQDQYEIITTENGSNTMASFVSFTKTGRVIGNEAKALSVANPESTIFDVKRIIGRRFEDNIVQQHIKDFPFEVVNNDNNLKIKINRQNKDVFYYPEEISAMILEKLKENAERHLKTTIQKAVITVPAHFNNSQRQATKDAGRIAGLEVLRIINEPTAAILAYGIDRRYKSENKECNVLVYDFGGGTFDVSVITVNNGVFEVKATDGNTNLGGDDIDIRLLNHFISVFKTEFNKDLTRDKSAIRRLHLQCEKFKIVLSSADGAILEIDDLYEGCDFRSCVMRSDFENMCDDIFFQTIQCIVNVLKAAKMKVEDIQEIVMIGGSTRIPKVRDLVKGFFDGKELNTFLDPDETVAIGASVQAAILNGDKSDVINGLLLMDVNSLSLGTDINDNEMSIVIPRNTQIPVVITKFYSTCYKNQTNITICIFEGENKDTRYNNLLGEFVINGLTPRKPGKTVIRVTFHLNTNGILEVIAREYEKGKNNFKSININCDKSRLSDREIVRISQEAAKLKEEDAKWAKSTAARLKLEEYCNKTLERLKCFIGAISDEHRQIIETSCNSTLNWIPHFISEAQEKDYEIKEKEVYTACNPIIRQYL